MFPFNHWKFLFSQILQKNIASSSLWRFKCETPPNLDYVLQNFSLRALTSFPEYERGVKGIWRVLVTDGDQLACLPKMVPVLALNVPYPGKSLSLRKSKNIYIASHFRLSAPKHSFFSLGGKKQMPCHLMNHTHPMYRNPPLSTSLLLGQGCALYITSRQNILQMYNVCADEWWCRAGGTSIVGKKTRPVRSPSVPRPDFWGWPWGLWWGCPAR